MKDSKYGFKVFLFCMIIFLLPSCAKFDLDLGSSGGGGPVVPPPPPPIGFGLTTPSDNDRFFRGSSVNAEGVCDEAGGSVSITGTSIVGGAIDGDCAADGTFSIPITIVSSGEGLDLNATQTDSDGAPQNDSAINLMVHCVQDALSELMTCPLTGSGNSTDPYMLSDIECLQEMRDGLRCYYALANDIDASATQTWNGGLGFEPVPLDALALKFEGFLDGRGHTISGLHIEQRNETGTGLFSKVFAGIDPTPRVHDLIISGATVEGYHKVGVVVGGMNNARIRNVQVHNSEILASRSSGPVDLVGLIAGHSESAFYNDIEVRNSSLKLSMLVSGLDNYFDGIGGAIGGGTNSDINNIILDDVRIENAAGLSTMGAYRNIGGVLGRIDTSGWAINDAKLFTTISLSIREDPSIGGGRRAIMGVGGLL